MIAYLVIPAVGLPPSLTLPLQGGGKARGEGLPDLQRRPHRTTSLGERPAPNVPSPLEGEGQGEGAGHRRILGCRRRSLEPRSAP